MKNLLLLFSVFLSTQTFSQCMLYEVSLDERVKNSTLIIEGTVTDQHTYREGIFIYTRNSISVHKVFKGKAGKSIKVLTEGGMSGDIIMQVSSSLQLAPGEKGMFLLHPSGNSSESFKTYADMQGFIRYDGDKAFDIFNEYASITKVLYPSIIKRTGISFSEKTKTISPTPSLQKGMVVPFIASFSPSVISAGTGSVLTINGTGFGATQGNGTVEFRTANSLGASFGRPLQSEIISWTDTEIQLKVPSFMLNSGGAAVGTAGTGTFRVINNDLESALSSSALTIEFAALNGFSSVLEKAGMSQHIDDNLSGGYTYQMNNLFAANTSAVQSFNRAFNNWICNTQVNWIQGQNTSIAAIADDGTNVITFDDSSPLPPGVAGRAISAIRACLSSGNLIVRAVDCDIIFDNALNWNFSSNLPAANQIDFETVALHELGHLVMLDHVINPSAVMHPSLSSGVAKRILNAVDLNGASFILDESFLPNACGIETEMIPYNAVPAPTISISASSNPSCSNETATFTATVTNAAGAFFQWKKNGVNVGTNSSVFTTGALNTGDLITCTISNTPHPCATFISNTINVTRISTPPPSSISGTSCVTNNTAIIYTASAVPNATSYQWNIPSGAVFNGANNTQSVSLTFPSNFKSGTITVYATANGCESMLPINFLVVSRPAQPGPITGGVNGFCSSSPVFNQPYSISPVPNTSGYTWTGTSGMSVNNSGNTSTTVSYASNFSSGVLTVVADNGPCHSTPRTLSISGLPAQPSAISGPSTVNPPPSGGTYSIPSVFGATSYSWTVSSGGTVFSGQGTTSATIFFNTLGTKSVCVRAVNSCGQSAQRCKSVTVGFNFRTEEISSGFTAAPNPATDKLVIYSNDETVVPQLIRVVDMNGKIVLEINNDENNTSKELNISHLAPGIYQVLLNESNLRFIKQ